MDIYILHKDDPDAAVGPIVEALNEERAAGRIGAFGGSSWTHQRIAEANAYAEAHGLQPFTVSSPNLALAVPNEPMWVGCVTPRRRRGGAGLVRAEPRCRSSPGRRRRADSSAAATRRERRSARRWTHQNVIRTYFSDANWERYRRAEELAKKKGCTLQQITLAWVLHQPLDVYRADRPGHRRRARQLPGRAGRRAEPGEVAWLNLQKEPIGVVARAV